MRVAQIMSQPAVTCGQDDTLDAVARLMWDHDCGAVPVVGDDGTVVGLVTDRDVCMAAYTQGRTLQTIPVSRAMARQVFSCRPEDSIETAERLMADLRIRRLPVVDGEGRPLGVLSLADIARAAMESRDAVVDLSEAVRILAAICQPRRTPLR